MPDSKSFVCVCVWLVFIPESWKYLGSACLLPVPEIVISRG